MQKRARDYLSKLQLATCLEESHSSFCFPFFPFEFLATVSNLSSFITTNLNQVAHHISKHLSRCVMDFFYTLSIFLSIWKTSSVITTHKMGKLISFRAFFRPISPTSCVSKLYKNISYLVYSSFWSLTPFFLPPGRFPSWTVYSRSNSVSFSVYFGWFNKSKPGCWKILATIDLSKNFDSVWHAALFHKPFSAGLLFLLVGLNLSFSTGASKWFSKITKVAPFESAKACFFSLFINDFASAPFSVSYCLHDNLAM